MILAIAVLALAVWPPAGADEEVLPAKKKVTVNSASFNKKPSTTQGFIREAEMGEEVTVLAYEGIYARVQIKEGEAYITKESLVPSAKYVKGPANEKQMMEMKGQGYEAGRFDPQTEKEYRKQKGPEMDRAYHVVDELEERQGWILKRATVAQKLEEFRKAGKLADYSNVK